MNVDITVAGIKLRAFIRFVDGDIEVLKLMCGDNDAFYLMDSDLSERILNAAHAAAMLDLKGDRIAMLNDFDLLGATDYSNLATTHQAVKNLGHCGFTVAPTVARSDV